MPVYEYYCRPCQSKFELLRPMKLADRAAACPSGHEGAERTLSVFAAVGRDERDTAATGGCACGGACSCRA
jgi:putative FmdB family regulatory protein